MHMQIYISLFLGPACIAIWPFIVLCGCNSAPTSSATTILDETKRQVMCAPREAKQMLSLMRIVSVPWHQEPKHGCKTARRRYHDSHVAQLPVLFDIIVCIRQYKYCN